MKICDGMIIYLFMKEHDKINKRRTFERGEIMPEQPYQNDSLGKCMSQLYHKGICLTYDEYIAYLLEIADWDEIIKKILKRFKIKATKQYLQKEDTVNLLYALLEKLALQLPVCAKDEAFIIQEANRLLKVSITDELSEENNAIFLRRYECLQKLLDYAKYMNITEIADIDHKFECDLEALIKMYQKEAYCILKYWQYHDIAFHERFMYRLISHFKELFEELQEDVQCDIFDLYLLHGDEVKAHRAYQQLLKRSKDYGKVAVRYATIVQQYENLKVSKLVSKLLEYPTIEAKWREFLEKMLF